MTRINALPENQLSSRIKRVLQEIDNIKSRQYVGADSIVVKQNSSTNTWDINDTVPAPAFASYWRVTFTPDTTPSTYVQVQYEYVISGTGSEFDFLDVYRDPNSISSTSATSFLVEYTHNNLAASNIQMKFAFKAADTGSISITRLPDKTTL